MSAIVVLSDVYVSKGYQGKDPVTFQAKEGGSYGTLRFRVGNKRYAGKDAAGKAQNVFDNYSIEWNGVQANSNIIELLKAPSVKVSLHGELSLETYEQKDTKKTVSFTKVTCNGRNAVTIADFGGEKKDSDDTSFPPEPPAADNSAL